jgi:alkylation response protein AidB-like acyl-CoA dehydrogenase
MSTITAAVRPGSPELRELFARIADGAEAREREQVPPFEQIDWIKTAGLTRLRVPVDEGGGGASLRELFETLIALAEADSNVAHILRVHYWFVEQQLTTADPDARARGIGLLNSGVVVGNGFSEQSGRPVGLYFDTTFTPEPSGGYRLNGTKYYSTGTRYSDYTQIWASAPNGRIAGAVIPVDREGVTIEDDWDGFGQRLTATGTTRLDNVHVTEDEYFDLGEPDGEQPPTYHGAFLQLYLQAVTAGVLRSVRNDAVTWVKRRRRNFSHATPPQSPTADRQVLQVVGEIAADVFAAEAIVIRPRTRSRRRLTRSLTELRQRRQPRRHNSRQPRRRSRSIASPTQPPRSCSTSVAPRRRRRSTTSIATGATYERSRPTTRPS